MQALHGQGSQAEGLTFCLHFTSDLCLGCRCSHTEQVMLSLPSLILTKLCARGVAFPLCESAVLP